MSPTIRVKISSDLKFLLFLHYPVDSLSEEEIQSFSKSRPSVDDGASEGATGSGAASSLWSSEGTGTRIFGSPADEKSPASSTSNKKTEPNRTGNKQV